MLGQGCRCVASAGGDIGGSLNGAVRIHPDIVRWSGFSGLGPLLTSEARQRPGLIQSASQSVWPELSVFGLVRGIASSPCPKPLLLQPVLT